MRRKLTNLLAWIGALFLFGLLGTIIIGFLFAGQNRVPDRVIISVDFRNQLVEYIPDNLFAQISQARVLAVRDVVEAHLRIKLTSFSYRTTYYIALHCLRWSFSG